MRPPFDSQQIQSRISKEVQVGFAALKQGNVEGAREHFILLLEENPEMAPAHLGLGKVFATEGDYQKALEHFEAALAIQPDLGPARLAKADALERLGAPDEAVAEYQDALAHNPTMVMGYLRLARLLSKEDPAKAREILSEGVRHNPQDGGLRMALANALARSGEVGQGEAEFRRVIELKPDTWFAHFGLGTSLLRAGQYAPARDALTRAAALAPDKSLVHQALGAALAGLGDHARAAKAYDEALKLDQSNVRALVGAASARSAAGRHSEALDLLRRSGGRKASRVPSLQKATADIYLAMGRPSEALDIYRAMIHGSRREEAQNPALVELANTDPGDDPTALAKRLQAALTATIEEMTTRTLGDPQMIRNRLLARRQRNAG